MVEINSKFNEDFMKSYNNESDEGYFFEVNVQYPENPIIFTVINPFYQKN